MNSIEQNAQTLSSFGLTVKQAKVYLALVSLGTAPVGEISKLSTVRREEVYRILPKLERMGLIEKTLTAPVKLKATSIENALSILIREEEERAKNKLIELTSKKKEFLEHYRAGSKDKLGNGEQFSIISEKAVGLGKIETLMDSAQTEIEYVVSRQKLLQFLKFFAMSLRDVVAKGVKIKIISNTPHGEDEIPKVVNQTLHSGKSVSIRYLDNLPNHFLIIDSNQVLEATNTSGFLADNPLLWSNNLPHVMVYKKLFDELWNSSVESAALNAGSEEERLVAYLQQMKPQSHCMLIYETSEAKLRVLLNYAKVALNNNEAFVYVCSEASVEEVRISMNKFGLDVKRYENSGALKILDYTQHHIIDGKFDASKTITLWNRYYTDAISKGFKGLRITEETACFFKHNLLKELVDYERIIHQSNNSPSIAIFAYCVDQLMKSSSGTVYSNLAKIHGKVSFTSIDKNIGRIALS